MSPAGLNALICCSGYTHYHQDRLHPGALGCARISTMVRDGVAIWVMLIAAEQQTMIVQQGGTGDCHICAPVP